MRAPTHRAAIRPQPRRSLGHCRMADRGERIADRWVNKASGMADTLVQFVPWYRMAAQTVANRITLGEPCRPRNSRYGPIQPDWRVECGPMSGNAPEHAES